MATIAIAAVAPSLVDHAGDGVDRAMDGDVRQHAGIALALAEAGDLGPVDDGVGPAIGQSLAHVELDGVRAHVDHRVAAEPQQCLEAPGHALVAPVAEPDLLIVAATSAGSGDSMARVRAACSPLVNVDSSTMQPSIT